MSRKNSYTNTKGYLRAKQYAQLIGDSYETFIIICRKFMDEEKTIEQLEEYYEQRYSSTSSENKQPKPPVIHFLYSVKGKKYKSLQELTKDLNISYQDFVKFKRNPTMKGKTTEEVVEQYLNHRYETRRYCVDGVRYRTIKDIAEFYKIDVTTLRVHKKHNPTKSLEEIIAIIQEKRNKRYRVFGKEFKNLKDIANFMSIEYEVFYYRYKKIVQNGGTLEDVVSYFINQHTQHT